MEIREVNDQTIWENFFETNGSPSFLQSWSWGETQKKLGYDILRIGIYEREQLKCISLIIKIKAKRGNFLFIPHGPITKSKSIKLKDKIYIKLLLDYLIKIAKNENYIFIRIAPIIEKSPENQKIFTDLGFKTAPIYMHAETVWVLDLNRSEEELLSQMRKTTRYLIKRAKRDGVEIEMRTNEKAVDDFYQLYQETVKRENFVPFSKSYIKSEFEEFKKTNNDIFLFGLLNKEAKISQRVSCLSERASTEPSDSEVGGETSSPPTDGYELISRENSCFENKYLASALILFTKSTAFYHQGASIHSKIPVPYLLQWEAIREAKKRGCQFYNFWGIYQPNRTPKNWQGLTLFKTGFGGRQIDYLPTQDYIVSPKYYLSYLFEKLLNRKRGV